MNQPNPENPRMTREQLLKGWGKVFEDDCPVKSLGDEFEWSKRAPSEMSRLRVSFSYLAKWHIADEFDPTCMEVELPRSTTAVIYRTVQPNGVFSVGDKLLVTGPKWSTECHVPILSRFAKRTDDPQLAIVQKESSVYPPEIIAALLGNRRYVAYARRAVGADPGRLSMIFDLPIPDLPIDRLQLCAKLLRSFTDLQLNMVKKIQLQAEFHETVFDGFLCRPKEFEENKRAMQEFLEVGYGRERDA